MIGYEHISGMYFSQDVSDIMNYLETLHEGDTIALREALANLGVKEIPYIADKIVVIIREPLYRITKIVCDGYEHDMIICYENCHIDFGI